MGWGAIFHCVYTPGLLIAHAHDHLSSKSSGSSATTICPVDEYCNVPHPAVMTNIMLATVITSQLGTTLIYPFLRRLFQNLLVIVRCLYEIPAKYSVALYNKISL